MNDKDYIKRLEDENLLMFSRVHDLERINDEMKISLTIALFHLHGEISDYESHCAQGIGTEQVTPDPVELAKTIRQKFDEKIKIIERCPVPQEQALKSRLYNKFAEIVRKWYG